MAKHRLSNLPVVEHGVQVGNLSAKVVLKGAATAGSRTRVGTLMEGPLPTVERAGKIAIPGSIINEWGAVLVVDRNRPVDIITTRDVINYLARK
jgi:predicted transcriptional regulator